MSADNFIGVLILTDGYRVIHAGAIDNLWFTNVPEAEFGRWHPVRIFEYFNDSKPVFTKEDADIEIAKLYRKWDYVEYGVLEINMMPYSWDDIVEISKVIIEKELEYELSLPKPIFAEDLYQTKLDLYGVNDD